MSTKPFKAGDIIKVFFKSPAGSKSRQPPFEGRIIALRGAGSNQTFTVRKLSIGNVYVERIFPFESPTIEKVKLVKQNKVRRAKLYYLRKK